MSKKSCLALSGSNVFEACFTISRSLAQCVECNWNCLNISCNSSWTTLIQVKKRQKSNTLFVTESIAHRRLSSPPTLEKDVFYFNHTTGQQYTKQHQRKQRIRYFRLLIKIISDDSVWLLTISNKHKWQQKTLMTPNTERNILGA